MPLDKDELTTWASLATMMERVPRALDAQLQDSCGLTHFEFGVLYALNDAPHRTLRLSTLAGYASCTLSRLSRAISRMERRKLVTRTPDASDGRYTLGILTEAGHELVQTNVSGHHELVRRLVFEVLTEPEARQLESMTRRIARAAGPDEVWGPPNRADT